LIGEIAGKPPRFEISDEVTAGSLVGINKKMYELLNFTHIVDLKGGLELTFEAVK